jgi:hypothetical protein
VSFNNIDVLRLGKLTQILFSKGVLYQGSEDTREWEQIQAMKVTDQAARELRFMLQKSLGPAASQYRNPGVSNREFPRAQQATVEEFTAKFKEMNTTLKLEYQLWERALMAKNAKYMEPLALEVQSKAVAQKRVMCFDLYSDGTGVRGEAASADDTDIASGVTVVTLADTDTARGHVGAFEQDDLVLAYTQAGVAVVPTGGAAASFYAWKVTDKDFDNDTVTLTAVDQDENTIVPTASNIVATNAFYRVGQPTIPNLTSISDYGTATEALVGLESLAATDSRSVWGITMTGAYKGSVYDAGGDPMDAILFDKALSRGKRRVGQGRYKYKKACMADEVHTQLIDSRETDRRFMQVSDNKRGTTYFAYQHRNDLVECYTSEFVSKHRVWMLPERSSGEKVLEYHGSDWKAVKVPGGSEFHLNASANGGYTNDIVSYMRGIGVIICRHPAAIVGIRNFSLSV